jgi:hypothetical protein
MKSRRIGWAEHVTCMGNSRDSYRFLVERPDRKRSLGKPWYRWEDDIKIYLQEVGWGGVDWVGLAQERKSGGRL